MKMRRIIYLQTILKRTKSELTRKVYDEMKKDPMKNDWSEMVKKDFDEVGMEQNEKLIEEQTEYSYKNEVRKHIRKAALTELQRMQKLHTKTKDIQYAQLLEPQGYLTNPIFQNDESSLLFNLRNKTVKTFKCNFKTMNGDDLQCNLCRRHLDTQENALRCPVVLKCVKVEEGIEYEDLFSNITSQKKVTELYSRILKLREQVWEHEEEQAAYRGYDIPDHLAI